MGMPRNPSYKAVKFIDSTQEVLKSYNKLKTSKRKRTKLSEEQLNVLESAYRSNHHPTSDVKENMAAKIGIPVKNVQIWFQNRRAKDKSIKEHLASESQKRQAALHMQPYDSSNLVYIPEIPHMSNFYSESGMHPMGDYSGSMCEGMEDERNFHPPYDRKDPY